jgi:ribosome-binding protein aMBF1 (putative translation factor)
MNPALGPPPFGFVDARPWKIPACVQNWLVADSIVVAFGVVVQRRREALGLSQERLAHVAGIDRSYVSDIELGKKRLGLGIAQKVATGLGASLSELIAEAESDMKDMPSR